MITQVYPNPSNDVVFMHFNSADGGVYSLFLSDVLGNDLYAASVTAMKGENMFSLSLLPYPAAQYFVRLINGRGQTMAVPLVKR